MTNVQLTLRYNTIRDTTLKIQDWTISDKFAGKDNAGLVSNFLTPKIATLIQVFDSRLAK